MHIQVITIFPELFDNFLATSLVGRAVRSGLLTVDVRDLRDFTTDRHRSVDDEPYGGGAGMIMTAEPWLRAVETLAPTGTSRRILLSPQGARLNDDRVVALARQPRLTLMCGRYEGIDERVRLAVVDEELSIGDYVLSGGELPAMVLIEAISREIPGIVGSPESVERESFRTGLLDYPHYTRPQSIDGMEVPKVLLSGNHAQIEEWRRNEARRVTIEKRPDLVFGRKRESEEGLETHGIIEGASPDARRACNVADSNE